jgi:UPF0042 nucleotide-binding protein
VAIVLDVRGGVFFGELSKALQELEELSVPSRILFLEASDGDLVNRYESTRRRHPLAPADRVVEGIRKERTMMEALRGDADLIIDTSGLTPHELRDRIRDAFSDAPPEESLQVSLVSFGYKYGAPRDADLVIDCRFLPNPHWVEDLRPLPGTDDRVRTFVRGQPTYREFLRRLRALLGFMVPGFVARGSRISPSRSAAPAGVTVRWSSSRTSRASSATRGSRPRSITATSIAENGASAPNASRLATQAIG